MLLTDIDFFARGFHDHILVMSLDRTMGGAASFPVLDPAFLPDLLPGFFSIFKALNLCRDVEM